MDGLPPVVHSLASVHCALDQLNHGSLLEVLGLLVLFSETLEGGPQDSVDEFAQSFFKYISLFIIFFIFSTIRYIFHFFNSLFNTTCCRTHHFL